MISKTKGAEIILLPILFILFSLGGAIFGMSEEAIAFSMIMIPLVIAMGYDSIVGIMVTYVSTQIGFATSWMNPFSVAVAQGIARVPILSGSGQVALTMPLMSPLASMVGVSKQVSVLTFQLGDGFTNLIVPTCGSLIAVLGVAKLDWKKWAKFQFKFQSILFIASIIVIAIAVMIGY